MFLKEDEITEIFSNYLIERNWRIISRATGHKKGVDIVADLEGKKLCIEAKGGGSQSKTSKNFGNPFSRLQCQIHTDVAFASIPRMIFRYNPDYVGIVLPDDVHHRESVSQLLPIIKKIGAGAWLIDLDRNVTVLSEPVILN